MNKKIIIGLVGELASGKGTVVDYLKDKYSAESIKFSSVLRKTLDIYDLEISRDNLQKLSTLLRENFGQNILANAIAKLAKEINNDVVIIDGIRRFDDMAKLKLLPEFVLIFITADERIRYERCVERNENEGDKDLSFEDFKEKGLAETEKEILAVGKIAKYTIDNIGSLKDLHKQIDKILGS